MATKIIRHGINVADFKRRQTVDALARAIYYAVAERWELNVPIWEAASIQVREHFRDLADGVLLTEKPSPLPKPIEPVVVVNMSPRFTTGLRQVTGRNVVGMIEPLNAEVTQ